MINTFSAVILICGCLSLFIFIFFILLSWRLRKKNADEGNRSFYLFSLLSFNNAVFLISFSTLYNSSDAITTFISNRILIISAMFNVVFAIHFYNNYFKFNGLKYIRVLYAINLFFSLTTLFSNPAFLLNELYRTCSYYTGLKFGWLFRIWSGYILLLSLCAIGILVFIYWQKKRAHLPIDFSLRFLLFSNVVWLCTGIVDDLTAIQVFDFPPMTWVGCILVVFSITWLLIIQIELLNSERDKFYNALIYDHLTRVYSRSYLDIQIAVVIKGMHRRWRCLDFVICDIDNFKLINDTYGHMHGDTVIKSIGTMLLSHIRPTDIVARYGGDEFILVLFDIQRQEDVEIVLQRLQKVLTQTRLTLNHTEISLSCSFGYTRLYQQNLGTPDLQELLFTTADQALYQSKSQGKNRYTYKPLEVVENRG